MKTIRLYTPGEAVTKDSILILWDKVREGSSFLSYEVYVNGLLYSTVTCTDETITGLEADREYKVQVRTLCEGEEYFSEELSLRTRPAGKRYGIEEFGAVRGERVNNAEAIQRAIDACQPGGTVVVPAGEYYTGALFLHSDMTLELEEGARLIATGKKEDFAPFYYPYEGRWEKCFASLLNVKTVPEHEEENSPQCEQNLYRNIAIIGRGVIDGGGEELFRPEMEDYGTISRGRTLCIRNTEGLYLYGVTIRNSPAWCLHTIYCRNMTVNRITLYNKFDETGRPYTHFNGDGIDLDSCENVTICHSLIESQDDSIALKSGREPLGLKLGIPTENVRITNCELSYGFGIVAGSEMSGSVRKVLVQDIRANETLCAANLKSRKGRGGEIADIIYENVKVRIQKPFDLEAKWFRGVLCMDQFYGEDTFDADTPRPVDEETSAIHDVHFRNVELDAVGRPGIYICGLPEMHIRNVDMRNIRIHGNLDRVIRNADAVSFDLQDGNRAEEE